jgi:hypothetical protein
MAIDILKTANPEEWFLNNRSVSICGAAMVNATPVNVARNKDAKITSVKLKTDGFSSHAMGADM